MAAATNLLAEQSASEENSQMALVLAAQLQAEVQANCIMALKIPRDWDQVREKLLRECKRSSFAEVARYSVPRGDGKVQGFTIRFAEAAIQAAKHIHVNIRTIWEDDEQRKVLVKVWDAQEMVSYTDEVTIEKTIERRKIHDGQEVIRTRKNKQGDLLYIVRATEDDHLAKQNAQRSKAIRTAGLRLIPGWILDQALDEVRATLKKSDEQNPDAAKQKIFDALGEMGVSVADLKKFLGHEASTLTPKEIDMLRGLYQSIGNGVTTMHEVLEALDLERERNRQKEEAAMKGPEGTIVAGAGSTVQSVKDKILNRQKTTTIEGSTGSSSSAGEKSSTPSDSNDPKPKT